MASFIENKIGAEVSIGRIDLGYLTRIIIDDVVIKDQQGKEMIKAGRLSVKLNPISLIEGKILISSAQLFNVNANLYQKDSLTVPNYQFVLDSLSSKDDSSSSDLDLTIKSLIVRRSSFKYNRLDIVETPGLLNPNHLYINEVSAHVMVKSLTKDSINVNLKRLAFNEQSGLTVNRISAIYEANNHHATIRDFRLELPNTCIQAHQWSINYNGESMKNMQGLFSQSHITLSDLACINEQFRSFNEQISFETSIKGETQNISILNAKFSIPGMMSLEGNGNLDWQDKRLAWQTQIDKLHITNMLVKKLHENFKQVPEILVRLNDIDITGEAKQSHNGLFETNGIVRTGIGHATIKGSIAPNKTITSTINSDSINLGKLLDNKHLGLISSSINISGTTTQAKVNANISRLDYNNYSYHDIAIDGTYNPTHITGALQINDQNLQASLNGTWSKATRSNYQLNGIINKFSPKALNISEQWGDVSFTTAIDANFWASNLNNAEGAIDINNFLMTTNDSLAKRIYNIENLNVRSGYKDDKTHFLYLKGDIGEAFLKGHFDWQTLPQSFINYIASKLPTLPGLPQPTSNVNNDFELEIDLAETEWLEKLLGVKLMIDKPAHLQAKLNDHSKELDIYGQFPSFTYNDAPYQDGYIHLTTEQDTAFCELELNKIMDNGRQTQLSFSSKASDNLLTNSLMWDNSTRWSNDHTQAMYGTINTITQLYTNETGKAEAQVRILPSLMHLRGADWSLEPCDILYSDNHLIIDHFNISHGEQHLNIDGVASNNPADTITLDLNKMDVEYILDLVNFHSVDFAGKASGKVYANNIFGDFGAKANLEVEGFTFQGGQMGTLFANAEWNKLKQQIDIDALSMESPLSKTRINGYVSPVHSNIDLKINAEGTNLEFCKSFTSSFLKDISGQGHGFVEVVGPFGDMNLLGKVSVEGKVSVAALGTTYSIEGDTVHLVENDIQFKNFRIYDRNHHTGRLTGGVHHDHISNFSFDFDIEADNLLAYDFPTYEDGSTICGTVYTDGKVDLHGHDDDIIINCNVTPTRGSSFSYNAANPDAINQQNFITWSSRNKDLTDDFIEIQQGPVSQNNQSNIYINFLINATPDATLKLLMDQSTGDNISLRGNGILRAQFYNKGAFTMFGTYGVEEGTYGITIQNIIKKTFIFQPNGTISFRGDPFDANLNLQALYTVNGVSLSDLNIGNSFSNTVKVNCLMNITGTAGSPRIDFDLDMPNVNSEEKQMIRSVITSEQEMNQQVLYLLGIGRFYTQGANNAEQQQYGQTQLAMQSFLSGTVSTQINQLLSQVVNSNDWNFGANISTGNEGWNNAEYEGLVSGKMLNNRLLINGQFGYRDNAKQATPSFIGDFSLRYLLYPNGNLALKVYNQTNDRYFTRSSLNTQGIGLIMKKDFNGIRDLFRINRTKK
ncbi:MAG: translocation/assembly module TamB [Prevotella sp.]|nr:translocation/assembly module TamB [Prevotella sp.]